MLHPSGDGREDGDRGPLALDRRSPPRSLLIALLALGLAAALALSLLPGFSKAQRSAHASPKSDPMADAARQHAIRTLTEFDTGKVTPLQGGRALREYWIEARNTEIEVAPGVRYAAWTFNGAVPGPTLRCTEGDSILVHFTNKASM